MNGPVRILIAALGGEGGGVLASWIVDSALACGYVAQRTSVPGVAQRTGSTTYYIEMVRDEGLSPVLALAPTPGEIDLFIATELLEAGRLIQAGFVTPDRTMTIVPQRRVYTITEKIALADGRADSDLILSAVERFSKSRRIADFDALAAKAGSHLNAVLFGVAAQMLGLSADACRRKIEQDGRAVSANLRGFDAGLAYDEAPAPGEETANVAPTGGDFPFAGDFLAGCSAETRVLVRAGLARLADFQSERYALAYLERLARFKTMPGMSAETFGELARHLALRMSSEDVARVAQLKIRDARLARVKAESRARKGDIVHVTEYLKPGLYELFSMLPAPAGRGLLRLAAWAGLEHVSAPLRVRTSGLAGFLQMKTLSGLRRLRPVSLRASEEKAWIDEWLAAVERALRINAAAAHEIVLTAQLIKGYGDTWARGHRNWRLIVDALIAPGLAGRIAPAHLADAILQARLAAQADDRGTRLERLIASLETMSLAPAAQGNVPA